MTESLKFTFEVTADGSPTVRLGDTGALSEAMHSLKGAFSETVYIYGTALTKAFDEFSESAKTSEMNILSLGLGLGYVEILAAAKCLERKNRLLISRLRGESFELVPELRDWFINWATGQGAVPDAFKDVYDDILVRTSDETKTPTAEIRAFVSELLLSGRWAIRGALTSEVKLSYRFNCICFDAFSSKTSPDLWTEAFLLQFFKEACAESCVLSTYACTGALKRALKACDFEITIRQGFSSKRDSTFAVRRAVVSQ